MVKHLFYLGILLVLFSCNSESKIVVTQPQMPILTEKSNLILKVENPYKDIDVSQIQLTLEATKKVSDISDIEVYISPTNDFSMSKCFGKASTTNGKAIISGEGLFSYHGTIFVKAKVVDSVDLLNKILVKEMYITSKSGRVINIEMSSENRPQRTGITLRRKHQDGIDTYRIPGLATTNNGTLIAVYDNRYDNSADLQGNIDVGMSRSTDGGQTWEPMKTIMDMGEYGDKKQDENGIGDPSVLVDKNTNTIWVAALWQHGGKGKRVWWASKPGLKPEQTGQMMLVKSEDDGKTWSEPINITEQVKDSAWYLFFDGPGKGITLEDGTLVFPAQYKDKDQIPHSTIMYSKDSGNTWHSGIGACSHTTEAQVVQLQNGDIMLNMRDDRNRSNALIPNDEMKRLNQISIEQNVFWAEPFDVRNASDVSPSQEKHQDKVYFRWIGNIVRGVHIIPLINGEYLFNPGYILKDSHPTLNDMQFARTVMTTSDLGKTWKNHESSRRALPASNCMASIIDITDKNGERLYFFSNPSVSRGRNHITMKMSDDEATTWDKHPHIVLHEGETYGYSCMSPVDNGDCIGILYEGSGDLYFQKIPISDFFEK